VTKKLDHY